MKRKSSTGIFPVLAILMSILLGGAVSAQSQSLLIEDFNYTAGTSLTSTPNWTAHSGAGTNPITVTTPGLTLTGYPSSGVGNAVTLTTTGEDDNRTFATQSSGTVYTAFLVNVSDAIVDPIGGYFFHIGPDPIGTTFRGRVFAKKDANNALSFGISKAATAAPDVAFTPFSYSLNTTYLLILKYTIVDGTGNDTVSLTVSTTVPGTEPAATVTATDVSASDINPGSVALRQGTTGTSPTVRIDGIRVGTTYASVTQPVVSAPVQHVVDFNGDGKTDWAVTRGVSGQMLWFVQNNGTMGATVTYWGLPTDKPVPEDYDGDGKSDVAVWRETGNAQANRSYFYILRSSNNTFQSEQFGTTGDNPSIVGDYDGDNKADVAVFRPSDATNLPCGTGVSAWYYRPSGTAGVDFRYQCWGKSGDNPAPGDFDGDNRNDFAVQQNVGGNGVFAVRTAAGTTSYNYWGLATDVFIPGDYDADGKTDYCVRRTVSGMYHHFILTSTGTGGTGAVPIVWGSTGDLSVPGDYDADGKTDVAVWRANADATMNYYYVRQSTTNGFLSFEWGQQGDYPVANYPVR